VHVALVTLGPYTQDSKKGDLHIELVMLGPCCGARPTPPPLLSTARATVPFSLDWGSGRGRGTSNAPRAFSVKSNGHGVTE
jgi:hypothetical protein